MKRIIVIFLLAALLLLGCAPEETVHTVTVNRNGIDYAFTVDTEHCTISDGQYNYTYTVNGDHTTITYPNGARYYWTQNGMAGFGGWDDHYDPQTYTDGDMLINVIDETTPEPKKVISLRVWFLPRWVRSIPSPLMRHGICPEAGCIRMPSPLTLPLSLPESAV